MDDKERHRQVWKDLVDSLTQHPSTKPFKPLTIREQQLEAEIIAIREAVSRIWTDMISLSVRLGEIVVQISDRHDDNESPF